MKNQIKILNEFKGSMIGDYSIKDNSIFLSLKKEKPTLGFRDKKFDYNLHFNFGLSNLTDLNKEIKIFLECSSEKELKYDLPWLWISEDNKKEYKFTKTFSGKTNFHGKYYIKILLESNQTIYLSNYPPRDYEKILMDLNDLTLKSVGNKVIVGKTVEGRNIIAYEYGDVLNKPTILFVSGFHPPERDSLAILAIMERLVDSNWKGKILNNYSFSFIPILNPDGFFNAMQGSNINEINFHWKFFGNSKIDCPESHNIWNYCKNLKPIVFFDFHSFTFQNNNPRPYLIPEGYYISKKARLVQKYINLKLSELCNNNFSKNEIILSPDLLATGLRNEIGTITIPKFHIHMKDGIKEAKKMALNCFDIIIQGLSEYNIKKSDEILKKPYGKIKYNMIDRVRIKILDLYYLWLIPFLKKILFRNKN